MEKEVCLWAWEDLARAVVCQAGQDYVELCRHEPGRIRTRKEKKARQGLEEFFLSSKILILSGINGEQFLEELKRRISANGL